MIKHYFWTALSITAICVPVATACDGPGRTTTSSPANGVATAVSSDANTITKAAPESRFDCDGLKSKLRSAIDGPIELRESSDYQTECDYSISIEGAGSLGIRRYAYNENRQLGIRAPAGNFDYGGATPSQVYSSALSALTGARETVIDHPEIGQGVVLEDGLEFVLAADGGYWFTGEFGGTNDDSHNPVLIAIAKALATG